MSGAPGYSRRLRKDSEWTGEDEVIVAKQREGLIGSQAARLDPNRLWFVPQ